MLNHRVVAWCKCRKWISGFNFVILVTLRIVGTSLVFFCPVGLAFAHLSLLWEATGDDKNENRKDREFLHANINGHHTTNGVTFEVLIFAEAAANIAVELWWWLHGTSQAGWYRIGASLIAFVVAVVSWRYVKAANRAAAAALQSAIKAPATPA